MGEARNSNVKKKYFVSVFGKRCVLWVVLIILQGLAFRICQMPYVHKYVLHTILSVSKSPRTI